MYGVLREKEEEKDLNVVRVSTVISPVTGSWLNTCTGYREQAIWGERGKYVIINALFTYSPLEPANINPVHEVREPLRGLEDIPAQHVGREGTLGLGHYS